ncbi:MAG TPA: DUF2914 domain-containing protein [candidate division Zixibacteria bacterium]|nr:DUF2914 domain-containing protein [candidate division Zixibacteria bacterium]
MSVIRIAVVLLLLGVATSYAQDSTMSVPFTSIETAVCSGISDRMPVGEDSVFSADVDTIYVWTKLSGAMDTTEISHVWTRDGEEIATVVLPVRSPSWRTWSYKSRIPKWSGNWEVKIEDAQGNILKSVKFRIEPAAEESVTPMKPDSSMTPADSMK